MTDVGKRLNSLFKDENLIIISNHFQKVLNTITNYLPLSIWSLNRLIKLGTNIGSIIVAFGSTSI